MMWNAEEERVGTMGEQERKDADESDRFYLFCS